MAPRTILVADDEPALRRLSADILKDGGCTVLQAADGREAIEVLKDATVDAVLLDLNMPHIDGWGVLEFVRTLEVPPPVVLVTGMSEVVPPGHLNRYVAGVVTKPFAVTQLLKTLELAWSRPQVVAQSGLRALPRRAFAIETTLLSETGQPLALGQLQEVSQGGFRVELSLKLEEGDPVRIAFRVPGREQPVQLSGRVRWHRDNALGAEIESVTDADGAVLRDLLAG